MWRTIGAALVSVVSVTSYSLRVSTSSAAAYAGSMLRDGVARWHWDALLCIFARMDVVGILLSGFPTRPDALSSLDVSFELVVQSC